jgi:rod shape determining protein RodA
MKNKYYHKSNLSILDKLILFDYFLVILILLLGVVSIFAMYSTEQGNFGYYTKSHLYRFLVFFSVFLIASFFKINFWYKSSYLFYFTILLLLFAVDFFGVTS